MSGLRLDWLAPDGFGWSAVPGVNLVYEVTCHDGCGDGCCIGRRRCLCPVGVVGDTCDGVAEGYGGPSSLEAGILTSFYSNDQQNSSDLVQRTTEFSMEGARMVDVLRLLTVRNALYKLMAPYRRLESSTRTGRPS